MSSILLLAYGGRRLTPVGKVNPDFVHTDRIGGKESPTAVCYGLHRATIVMGLKEDCHAPSDCLHRNKSLFILCCKLGQMLLAKLIG
jgi:hypothetical protein